MGVRFNSLQSNTLITTTLVTNAETVVCILPPFNIALDNATIFIFGQCVITTGSGTSGLAFTLRRGTTTAGARLGVNSPTYQATGATTLGGCVYYFDTPGAVAGQQYCLTAAQGAAVGNGTVVDACILAFAL